MGSQLFILIAVFLLPALIAAFSAELLSAAIALLICSVGLTLLLFNMGAPLAAVFELSVCAGLITVLFVNTISLISPGSHEERCEKVKNHRKRFALLPVLVAATGIALWNTQHWWVKAIPIARMQETQTIGEILWGVRGLDLVGQVAMMLVGVYGVVVLFKRGKANG